MGYSAEVVRRARARLAQAKADREAQNQRHLRKAYEQVPRIQEIDKQLRITMAMAAQAAFANGSDFDTAMEAVREKNLALQRERQILAACYFEEGYLDDTPICTHCDGSGYVGSFMCKCLRELCRQEQKKELTLLNVGQESFEQFRLDYYPNAIDPKFNVNIRTLMEKTFHTCRKYAMTFNERSGNLLFSGDTGLGKTFLSACIAKTVADRGFSVAYESAGHMFSKMERAKFENDPIARDEIKNYMSCDLLIVDDLGTEMPSQFVTSALYTLINDRLLTRKAMIMSTNLNNDDLTRRYGPQIVSRLRGNFTRVAFLGEDIRVKKNWG